MMNERSGRDVTTEIHRQSAIHTDTHGMRQAARVKKRAILMLATNVRHLGPTYSNTETVEKL